MVSMVFMVSLCLLVLKRWDDTFHNWGDMYVFVTGISGQRENHASLGFSLRGIFTIDQKKVCENRVYPQKKQMFRGKIEFYCEPLHPPKMTNINKVCPHSIPIIYQ